MKLLPEREARGRSGKKPTAFRGLVTKRLIPRPIKVNDRNFWPDYEIEAINRARVRRLDETAIRLLVEDLEAQRDQLSLDPATVRAELAEAA